MSQMYPQVSLSNKTKQTYANVSHCNNTPPRINDSQNKVLYGPSILSPITVHTLGIQGRTQTHNPWRFNQIRP